MNPRLQWLVIIALSACIVGYTTYASRKPGPCAFVHTGTCATGAHGRGYYSRGYGPL
jgi:hypothetical protein